MTNNHIHHVTRNEVHYLPLCQCDACNLERTRRSSEIGSGKPGIVRISPSSAYLLGLIPSLNPAGSVAKHIRKSADSHD